MYAPFVCFSSKKQTKTKNGNTWNVQKKNRRRNFLHIAVFHAANMHLYISLYNTKIYLLKSFGTLHPYRNHRLFVKLMTRRIQINKRNTLLNKTEQRRRKKTTFKWKENSNGNNRTTTMTTNQQTAVLLLHLWKCLSIFEISENYFYVPERQDDAKIIDNLCNSVFDTSLSNKSFFFSYKFIS